MWFLGLPMLVVMLFALATVEALLRRFGKAGILPWLRNPDRRWVSSVGWEVLHGNLSAGKAQELKQRNTELRLREDQYADGRPNTYIDLDAGKAVIRPKGQ